MKYAIWPMACIDGQWSIPDDILLGIWKQMVNSGKATKVFYNGTVRNADEWMAWTKSIGNYFVLVVNASEKKIAAVGWINAAHNGYGLAHFCVLGMPRPEMGSLAINYWKSLGYFNVLIGITPETYSGVLRFIEKIGFVRGCTIPYLCELVYEGKIVGGVISYFDMKEA